jgi:hypothetical protein
LLLWLLSRPLGKLLGWGEAPVIRAMSESGVLSHQRSLWKQADRKRDVATSQNRGTWLLWLQSRPFTIATRVLESARHRSYERIEGATTPVNTTEASGPKIEHHYQPQQRILVVFDDFTTFDALYILTGAGGAQATPASESGVSSDQ